MTPFIQLLVRRGDKADLPVLGDGELGFCEDTNELFIGFGGTNLKVNTSYTPDVPLHWSGSPADIFTAINRLAAAVYALRGSPIP